MDMGIILAIIAKVIFIVFLPLAIAQTIIVRAFNWNKLNAHFYNIGLSIDQLGNVVYRDIFKLLFITKYSTFDFGNADHTVSYVIAKNYYAGNTTILGYSLGRLLDYIDRNHMIKAIINNEGKEAAQLIIDSHKILL